MRTERSRTAGTDRGSDGRATRARGTMGAGGTARIGLLAAGLGALVAAAGCARQARVESEPATPEPERVAWSATLTGNVGSALRGEVTAEPTASGTRVRITLRDVAPGARLPWHVHTRRCGLEGDVVGSASAYPILESGAGGEATATAELDVVLDPEADYSVNVHASPDDLERIVACGRLRRS